MTHEGTLYLRLIPKLFFERQLHIIIISYCIVTNKNKEYYGGVSAPSAQRSRCSIYPLIAHPFHHKQPITQYH